MRARNLTTIGFLACLALAMLAHPARAQIWSTDHESQSLSDWYLHDGGGEFNSGNGISGVSTEQARSGRFSAKLTIDTDGSDHGVRLVRWLEPKGRTELYYSAWYYFPQRYQVSQWWNTMQWKSKTGSRNDPFWIVNIGNRPDGNMYYYLYDWMNRRAHVQTLKDVPVGRWFHLEGYYRRSSSNAGQVTIWQDGEKILDVNNVPTTYPDAEIHWSVTNYSNGLSPGPSFIYADDALISTSRVGVGQEELPPEEEPPPEEELPLGVPGRPEILR